MLITRIEKSKGKQYRIYADNTYIFSLYRSELRKYGIEEGACIDDALMDTIMENVIYKRARERAFYLLDRQAYTVSMLRKKLEQGGVPAGIVDRIVDMLIKYDYLNDHNYVKMFVDNYSGRKSKRQIISALIAKGIDRQLIFDFFEQNEYSDDECFKKHYDKYIKGKDLNDMKTRQKVFRYFYSKGYAVSVIEDALRQ